MSTNEYIIIPQHKIVIVCSHFPPIAYHHAIEERIVIIPFIPWQQNAEEPSE